MKDPLLVSETLDFLAFFHLHYKIIFFVFSVLHLKPVEAGEFPK